MKVQVQLINERGRPLPSKSRAKMPTYRGILRVNEERVQELGRAVVVAELVSETEASANPVLPTLHDASMLYVKDNQIRVRGFEFVEGAQYGQTWDIKVL